MAKEKRKRNWLFVVYPESAPENWREVIQAEHVPGYISPLHDADINADGEPKKAHWHVLLTFAGLKTFEQVKSLTNLLNAPAPIPCEDIRGAVRYLCHLDNPEKAQYRPADVVSLGGNDYLDAISCPSSTDGVLSEIQSWCIKWSCYSFFMLSEYARHNKPEWYRVITSQRTMYLQTWLKSLQWEINNGTLDDTLERIQELENAENEHHEHHENAHDAHDAHENAHKIACVNCGSISIRKRGKTAADLQRYECKDCGKTFTL
jgi:predicted RNA-binding Zn-ribbon protein involved in translation (DUF1610 family)